jgi:hypothetical protein
MRPLPLDQNAFNEPLSKDARYWIGRLMSDGNVHVNRRKRNTIPSIALVAKAADLENIRAFRSFLKSGHKIGFNRSTNSVRFGFMSRNVASDLARYGVVPQKSLTAKVVGLETDSDFWRGVVDGDGSVRFNKLSSGHYPEVSVAGSQSLMVQYSCFVRAICPDILASVRQFGSIFRVVVHGASAARLSSVLYYKACTALRRKQAVANTFPAWLAAYLKKLAERKIAAETVTYCRVQGCGREEWTNKLCGAHYHRLRKHGRLHRILRDWSAVTGKQLNAMHKRLGAWTKVASELGVDPPFVHVLRRRLQRR